LKPFPRRHKVLRAGADREAGHAGDSIKYERAWEEDVSGQAGARDAGNPTGVFAPQIVGT